MSWALSVYMYCRHNHFHTFFDLLKYGLMSKYNVICSSLDPMEELTATPPYPSWSRTWAWVNCSPPPPPPPPQTGNPDPSLKFSCQDQLNTEQDVLTMKESPLKNLILFFLRPHHHGGDCKMTNSFCCLYLLFSVSVPAPSSLLKCLTLAPTTYMYYMYVLVYSLLHICDSMAGHWTTSPPCLQVVAPGHKEHEEPATIGWRNTVHWVQSSGQD